jgi:hypothetical protein
MLFLLEMKPRIIMERIVRRDMDRGEFDREFWRRAGPGLPENHPRRPSAATKLIYNGGRTCGEPIFERLGTASPSIFSAKLPYVSTERGTI